MREKQKYMHILIEKKAEEKHVEERTKNKEKERNRETDLFIAFLHVLCVRVFFFYLAYVTPDMDTFNDHQTL